MGWGLFNAEVFSFSRKNRIFEGHALSCLSWIME